VQVISSNGTLPQRWRRYRRVLDEEGLAILSEADGSRAKLQSEVIRDLLKVGHGFEAESAGVLDGSDHRCRASSAGASQWLTLVGGEVAAGQREQEMAVGDLRPVTSFTSRCRVSVREISFAKLHPQDILPVHRQTTSDDAGHDEEVPAFEPDHRVGRCQLTSASLE
jgi:hypothetical protein